MEKRKEPKRLIIDEEEQKLRIDINKKTDCKYIKNQIKSKNETRKKEIKSNEIKPNKFNIKEKAKIEMKRKLQINLIIFKLLKIMALIQILSSYSYLFIKLQIQKISLKIKGIGDRNILGHIGEYYFGNMYYPKEIYINGERQILLIILIF